MVVIDGPRCSEHRLVLRAPPLRSSLSGTLHYRRRSRQADLRGAWSWLRLARSAFCLVNTDRPVTPFSPPGWGRRTHHYRSPRFGDAQGVISKLGHKQPWKRSNTTMVPTTSTMKINATIASLNALTYYSSLVEQGVPLTIRPISPPGGGRWTQDTAGPKTSSATISR